MEHILKNRFSFIHEKLKKILNIMIICVIKTLSFLIVYAKIEKI